MQPSCAQHPAVDTRNWTIESTADNTHRTNNCSYTVWPGILTNAAAAQPPTIDFVLSPGQSRAPYPSRMAGTAAYADAPPTTAALAPSSAPPAAPHHRINANFRRGRRLLQREPDGYNMPMMVAPPNANCEQTGYPADLNGACPLDLRVVVADVKVACLDLERMRDVWGGGVLLQQRPRHAGDSRSTASCGSSRPACPRAYSYTCEDASVRRSGKKWNTLIREEELPIYSVQKDGQKETKLSTNTATAARLDWPM
ncbi:hypothetical protein CFC21_046306 [Triticum aestivum]|uniref:Uncharacterized protein n=2 Tax=Triticum aestivum TaxID=4565 RepID=A0A3B6GP03_WHEAT|nr:hypothetical protein CFC21_046306 [Triticum aestivum]